jgi:hypothetical protein
MSRLRGGECDDSASSGDAVAGRAVIDLLWVRGSVDEGSIGGDLFVSDHGSDSDEDASFDGEGDACDEVPGDVEGASGMDGGGAGADSAEPDLSAIFDDEVSVDDPGGVEDAAGSDSGASHCDAGEADVIGDDQLPVLTVRDCSWHVGQVTSVR